MIEIVDGDIPIGICVEDKCTGESALGVIRFRAWHLDLHYAVREFIAQPLCVTLCRGCFVRKAS